MGPNEKCEVRRKQDQSFYKYLTTEIFFLIYGRVLVGMYVCVMLF